jgi:predicted regulator of Ras-like GTPase activity (Roadblock/LC7/MglB family)
MTQLDDVLGRFRAHEGVEHVVLLGRDGLVVQQLGRPAAEVESLAARIPDLAAAGDALGAAAAQGDLATAVLEFHQGVAVVVTLSSELLLAVLVRQGVGFAPLLRDLRSERDRLIQLL